MKHNWWTLTRADGSTSSVLIVPEVAQETADRVAAKLYDGGKLAPDTGGRDGRLAFHSEDL